MNRKALYSILSTIVAMVVLSVSLVFAIGPRVSAARVDDGIILVFDSREDFVIDGNGVLTDLSESAFEEISKYDIYEECQGWWFGSGIESIKYIIPDGVKSLNWYPVGGSMITSVELPDGLETIGDNAFYCCHCLTSIKLPNTVNKIGEWAFFGCESLASIVIPLSVTEIAEDVFRDCSSGLKIYCVANDRPAGWNTQWNRITEDTSHGFQYYYYDVEWNCNKTIAFNTQNGSTVENQTVCVDNLVVEPTAPTKDGYEFKGWYTDAECTDAYDFETAVTDDMTLYAKWEEVQTQPEPTAPETPSEENAEVNNQNNAGLIWGIAGTAAGILIIAGIVVGIIISKRRRK